MAGYVGRQPTGGGFCKAKNHYKYIGTHTDDLIVVAKDTLVVFKELHDNYKFKSTEMPKYHLGVDYVSILDSKGGQMEHSNVGKKPPATISVSFPGWRWSPPLSAVDWDQGVVSCHWLLWYRLRHIIPKSFSASPFKDHLEDLKRVYMYLNRFPDRKIPMESHPLEEIGGPVALEEANFQEYYFDAKEDIDL
eukprot:8966867-Ditylum_brightwellii.AAC.1